MYATQPLLPQLRIDFHANEAHVAATISALTFAVALAAPFVGPLADAVGRKRVIVTAIFALALVTFGASHARGIGELIAWRFAQGLVMPGIFATTLAYIAEEFPADIAGSGVAAYIGGNVFGGWAGRYLSALVAAHATWQAARSTSRAASSSSRSCPPRSGSCGERRRERRSLRSAGF
jgi:MFS family permease